jgi:L-amino acid N-acyltransferase YncA
MPVIRPAEGADAAGIAAVYRPYVTEGAASFEQDPPDAAEIARRMVQPPRLPWFVATRDEVVVGYCYASQHRQRPAYRWSIECSVYLPESERGRGTGRALYERLFPEVRALGYVRVFAGITLPNDASVGLHRGLGFVPVGVFRGIGFKRGAWHDVGWWQLTLAEPTADPAEPRPWTWT